MASRGDVVWATDPFRPGGGNPRPWLVLGGDDLPYPDEESIAAACTTRSHHPGSLEIDSDAWRRGEPETASHVLPWTVATLKDDRHVVGRQGHVGDALVARVVFQALHLPRGAVAGHSGQQPPVSSERRRHSAATTARSFAHPKADSW